MFYPELKNQLSDIVKHYVPIRYRDDGKSYGHKVTWLFNVDTIKPYLARFLSEPIAPLSINETDPSKESFLTPKNFHDFHPDEMLHGQMFFILSQILATYFQDLENVASNTQGEAVANEIGDFKQQILSGEIIKDHMYALLAEAPVEGISNPSAKIFSDAANARLRRNRRFGEDCPLGKRISTIYAIQPYFDSRGVVQIDPEKRKGALLEFIYYALKDRTIVPILDHALHPPA